MRENIVVCMLKGTMVKGALFLGFMGGFSAGAYADETQNANSGLMPVAQQLKEREQQKAMESSNKWDNTKNFMKRGFKGSCTKDCVENTKLCDDKEKKEWCLKNCEGKYKSVKTGEFFKMENKCPSTLTGKAGKMFKNPFGK